MMSTLNNPVHSQPPSSHHHKMSHNKISHIEAEQADYGSAVHNLSPRKPRWSLIFASPLSAALVLSLSILFLLPTTTIAAPSNQTTPLPISLTIVNEIEPATTDLFDLQLNGEVVTAGVGDGGTTGAIVLPVSGTYTVSVQGAANVSLEAYETTLTCIDNSGTTLINAVTTSAAIDVAAEAAINCTFSHVLRPAFVAKLDDTLLIDADVETDPGTSPGDTIQLRVVITKEMGITATNVVFSIPIDTNTVIVAGTLVTSQGNIAQGASSEDTAVRVLIGDVADDTPIVITWNVMVNSPLASNVDRVSFQGQVSSDNGLAVATDDPSIPALADPTEISVTAKPLLNVTHFALLLIDADNDQMISAGDRVYYEVVVINIGNGPANNLLVEGTIDENTELVPASLMSTQGSVSADERTVRLNAGTLNGGEAKLTLNYHVVVDSETMATAISSQFEASADLPMEPGQRIRVLSDDPQTLTTGDATIAPIQPSQDNDLGGIFLPYISSPSVTR